ncbi:MAG: hypothetical protein SPJ62_03980 [Inconstantimicrobium porci]|uniref:DUF7922 domain-containing protein n=1 Tax=Inconstantimicrobium porci TaxID=2652291 RepID=UPI002A90BAC0|nr:hypothetical protein [Inconstantimicrobium porci]MDY5911159.1 hypothetical protein [Inconstantimicrobium porci]
MAHSRMMRNFIILQEDEKDQSVSKDKVLSGYVKIETRPDRCRISFYAQNIKADQNRCYMALICYKKDAKQIINIGALSIGREGKCDTGVEFPINDIAGLGLNAEKIIGAAIYKEIQGRIVYLMYGFINGHVPKEDWKKFSKVKCKGMEKEEEKKPKLEIKKEEPVKEKSKNLEVKVKDECDDKDKKVEKECKKKDDFFDNEYIDATKCKDKDKDEKCDKDKDDDYKKYNHDHHDDDEHHDHHDNDEHHDHHDNDEHHDHHDNDEHHDHHDDDEHHDHHDDEHHDHHDDGENKECKKCSSMEQSVPTIEGVSDDIPLEMPLNITSMTADEGFINAVRSDENMSDNTNEQVIDDDIDSDLLRTLKLKAIESELEEVKEKICSINKKNEEAILAELKKFKELCLCQMQSVVQAVPKALGKEDKPKCDSKKRETNTFDDYEQKIDDARYDRLEKNNVYEIKGKVGEYFNRLLSGVKNDTESIKDIKYCKWYNIPVDSIQQMCNKDNLSKQGIIYKIMVNNYPYIIKNHHFMFGIKGDQEGNAKYLVYAVPGTNNVKDQPYGGKSGFVTWVQAANKEKGMGYWLMFYDYKNEILVVPMKEN